MELKERHCPVCGLNGASSVYSASNIDESRLNGYSYASRKAPELMHFRLMLCATCGLLYASPAPGAELLQGAYEEAAYDSMQEAQYAARTYMKYANGVLANLPDRQGALDIGAGDGAFLGRLMEAGFTRVEGVEPSAAPIRAAEERVRPLLKKGIFREEDFQLGAYSLVSCFMTMEHLADPGQMCRAVMKLLKPGGAFITVTHNYQSFLNRLMGDGSPIFDIEHLQLFSPQSMRHMLEASGFAGVKVFPLTNTYPLHYWMKIAPLGSGLKKWLISFSKSAGFGYLPAPIRGGNMFAVGYKPNT